MINTLRTRAIDNGIDIDYVNFNNAKETEYIRAYGLNILRINKTIKGTEKEVQALLNAEREFNKIRADIRKKSLEQGKPKTYQELARENHIQTLEARGIKPTQENIDKLIDEMYSRVRKLEREANNGKYDL